MELSEYDYSITRENLDLTLLELLPGKTRHIPAVSRSVAKPAPVHPVVEEKKDEDDGEFYGEGEFQDRNPRNMLEVDGFAGGEDTSDIIDARIRARIMDLNFDCDHGIDISKFFDDLYFLFGCVSSVTRGKILFNLMYKKLFTSGCFKSNNTAKTSLTGFKSLLFAVNSDNVSEPTIYEDAEDAIQNFVNYSKLIGKTSPQNVLKEFIDFVGRLKTENITAVPSNFHSESTRISLPQPTVEILRKYAGTNMINATVLDVFRKFVVGTEDAEVKPKKKAAKKKAYNEDEDDGDVYGSAKDPNGDGDYDDFYNDDTRGGRDKW